MTRLLSAAAVVLALVATLGCAAIRGEIPAPRPIAEPDPGLVWAGAARTDITPLPGVPMGGFSSSGSIARGHWGRLHARAIYVRAPDGTSTVLVAADLWAIPAGMRDRVAELVTRDADGRHLGSARIVVAATHTHHGPANFSSSPAYNTFASSRAGFDAALFEWLSERIAACVLDAARGARPARLAAWVGDLPLMFRNRSIEPFRENPEADDILAENRNLPIGPLAGGVCDPHAYHAIDPSLRVLTLHATRGGLIGVAAFAATHPTSIGTDTTVYSPELFGIAAQAAESELATEAGADGPIVAVFNGAEGDVSAAWHWQGARETVRLGDELSRAIVAATDAATPRELRTIPVVWRRDLLAGAGDGAVGAHAIIGASALGGAEDGRTRTWPKTHYEGMLGTSFHTHDPKRPAIDLRIPGLPSVKPLSLLVDLAFRPPRHVPLAIHDVAGIQLVSIPGEATTVVGRRVRHAVAQASHRSPEDVWLIGLANEYVSYLATPEEYDLQHYEGASTLYGRETGRWLVDRYGDLARELGSGPEGAYAYSYGVGPLTLRCGSDAAASVTGATDELRRLVSSPRTTRVIEVRCRTRRLDLDRRVRLAPAVRIERLDEASGWRTVVTDVEPSVAFAIVASRGSRQEWRVAWGVDPAWSGSPAWHRIVIAADDADVVVTAPFQLSDPSAGSDGSCTVSASSPPAHAEPRDPGAPASTAR